MYVHLSVSLSCCVTFAESEPYCHSILFVWMFVVHSATYSLPRLIDHNQIWSAGIYLSSDPCKPFWIPCLAYFGCQREKYAKFRLFPTCILATANVAHRAILLVLFILELTCQGQHLSAFFVSALQIIFKLTHRGAVMVQ